VANLTETLKEQSMHLLVQGCLRNDRESQRLLYQHYYGYAMSVCLRYCKSKEEAREVLNDGFLKAFQKMSQYRMETSFESWLRRIMINASIDHYRKELKHYNHYSNEKISISNGQASALDEMAHTELINMVQQLTPAYRAVFNLYAIDGYTHEEIGQLLGISEGTSKSNLSKARENLRAMLERLNNKTLLIYV